jgi:uncharacterized membrane protein YgcG
MRFLRAAAFRRALVAVLLLLCGLGCASAFTGRELRIEKFEAGIMVHPDSSIDVIETIQAHFLGGPWHGLYREIPVEYVTPQGLNYTLFLDVKSITGADGHALKYESSRERHYRKLKIYVPDADNSVQTITIHYTVTDALRYFDDHDELYWNVTGDEWDVPIEAASAEITLPVGTTNIRVNPFTGGYRSRAQEATTNVTGNTVIVQTDGPLHFHEGLTVAVAFDKGFVQPPSTAAKIGQFFRSNWPLGLPILVFLGMFRLWWTQGRDPRLRPIAAQYEPPAGLTPGEVGTLVDDSVDMRDITASIVDLAVRGYILIEEKQHEHAMGLWHEKDYIFHSLKPRTEWAKLKPHEQELLEGVFSVGDVVSLSDLHNRFYQNIPSIKSGIFDSLVGLGYYRRRPDSVRSAYIGAAVVVGFLAIWGGNAIAGMLGMAPLTFILAGVISAVIIAAFGWFMPAYTETGTRALEGVLGFEDFLAHVESDRFNRMIKTPEMFEKFLPFAMALGVEKNWSKAFQGIYTQPPSWYRGAYGPNFYPMMFVSNLNSMSAQAGSVMASAPRSSGGSGFGGGGGGFSGGGFGGGGGGGF